MLTNLSSFKLYNEKSAVSSLDKDEIDLKIMT